MANTMANGFGRLTVVSKDKPQPYGQGSLYQRTSDWRWIGTIEAGTTRKSTRRRIPVTAKGCPGGCAPKCPHRAAIKRKLRVKQRERQAGAVHAGRSLTVKQWSETWLKLTQRDLAPKTWSTNRGQVRNWIVPTIGARPLSDLTHADLRDVRDAQIEADQASASIARTKAILLKMLKDAVADGHHVPAPVIEVQPRKRRQGRSKPEREGLELDEALRCVEVAKDYLPHASRWQVAFLQGLRQGEALGLTWDNVDLDNALLTVQWQLQPLPYRVKGDRSSGFAIPDNYEVRHLHDAFHLVRPKTAAGERVIPLVDWAVDSLRQWQEIAPESPHRLVWPRLDGRGVPKNDDLDEWKAIQGTAEVGHPSGRYYYGHEIRNTTATILYEAGVDEFTITAILGHTNYKTSRGYARFRAKKAVPAMQAVARALEMG